MRLNTIERKEALIFYNSLKNARNQLINGSPFDAVKQEVVEDFNAKGLSMEYFELADATNLSILNSVSDNAILLIAGYVGKIRLIDNMFVHEN
jgi:pantoate--beta-alanine ligase